MNCIYISGLEMPEGFAERGFVIRGDGRVRTFAGAVYDNAIAIPVPKHGRLTDTDALREKINRICDRYDAGIISSQTCMNLILQALISAPTIIPASEEGE